MTEEQKTPHRGRKEHQRYKSFVVLQYLLKNSDEDNAISGKEIANDIRETYGIEAERRSVYEDIKEINHILLMLKEGCTIDKAAKMLKADTTDELKAIVYDEHRKGFYVKKRSVSLHDLRLMAECVYASKFINQAHAKRLVDVICSFGSDNYAEQIKHDAFLVDRIKTNSRTVMRNIAVIRAAMSTRIKGKAHRPEKIRFKYLQHTINDVKNEMERRQGKPYVVNPFRLMINDGNYYLLTIDDKTKKPRPYRVDRMKDVELTGIARECVEEYKQLDMKQFARRTFSMFSGNTTLVEIQFLFTLLDTMVDRFGTDGVQYSMIDDKWYSLSAFVDISEQFYGWLLGFGRRVKLVGNEEAVKKFNAYLTKIYKNYNPETVADE